MKQLDIFIAFFRSSILGYGGGPTTIPLVQKEVVERFKWMNNEEFGDVLAIGNTLPGPIATKMAGYIGFRIGGILGMINAIFSTILPTIILMIIYTQYINCVQGFEMGSRYDKGSCTGSSSDAWSLNMGIRTEFY